MAKDKSINDQPQSDRFEAYPKRSDSGNQQEQQPEYVDQQPNSFADKSVSDESAPAGVRQNNRPEEKK